MEKEAKYALLIDADNISPKYLDTILSEAKEFGDITSLLERGVVGKFHFSHPTVYLHHREKFFGLSHDH